MVHSKLDEGQRVGALLSSRNEITIQAMLLPSSVVTRNTSLATATNRDLYRLTPWFEKTMRVVPAHARCRAKAKLSGYGLFRKYPIEALT